MHDVDELEKMVSVYNFSGMVPAPWGRLSLVENRTLQFQDRLALLLPAEQDNDFNQILSENISKTKRSLIDGQKSFDEIRLLHIFLKFLILVYLIFAILLLQVFGGEIWKNRHQQRKIVRRCLRTHFDD